MTLPIPFVVSAGDCKEIQLGEDGAAGALRELVTPRESNSSVMFGTFRMEPGQRDEFDLPHERGHEEEIYYMLSGRLRVTWEGGEAIASPGQAIYFPRGRRYGIQTEGSSAVELVWTAYPAPDPLGRDS